MRFSCIAVAIVTLASTSMAAPVRRGFLGDAAKEIGNLVHSNATLAGVAGLAAQSIENPKLTAARLTVVKSLADMQTALGAISSQASSSGNSGVSSLVQTAQQGVTAARTGVDNIGEALVSGAKPQVSDQKNVAVGIKQTRDAVNQMDAAITTPNAALSSSIAAAQTSAKGLQAGGEGVLSAEGLSFADLGLPDNFDSD